MVTEKAEAVCKKLNSNSLRIAFVMYSTSTMTDKFLEDYFYSHKEMNDFQITDLGEINDKEVVFMTYREREEVVIGRDNENERKWRVLTDEEVFF